MMDHLFEAAGEIRRLREERLLLRAREIARLVITQQRPGQDYATYPGRQLENATKRQEGTARENE